MINKIIILLVLILASCDLHKSRTGAKLEILDSSHKLILEDNDSQVDKTNKEFILISLSKKQSITLKNITSSKIGEDIYIKVDGVILNQFRISSSIGSGMIRINRNANKYKIFDNTDEGAKGLWPIPTSPEK